MVLEAKCPQCMRKAEVDDEMTEVKCKCCGFQISYDQYIEIMKSKAMSMANDIQMDWQRQQP
jgi:DNA-directed RNA polymerase subunit RPC12/RpoP